MPITVEFGNIGTELVSTANIRGRDRQLVESLAIATTTSSTFVLKPGATLTTGALTGTYRVRATGLAGQSNTTDSVEVRLRNTTDAVNVPAIPDTDTLRLEPKDSANREAVLLEGDVVFTGSAKTFEVQFRQQGGGTADLRAVQVELFRVA